MPLFEFEVINNKDEIIEEIFSAKEIPEYIISNKGRMAKRKISLIARTQNRWGDTCGYYDSTLKTYIENSQHRERVMKEQGLVDARDLSKTVFNDNFDKRKRENEYWDKRNEEWHSLVAEHGEEKAGEMWGTREKLEKDKEFIPDKIKNKSLKELTESKITLKDLFNLPETIHVEETWKPYYPDKV